MYRVFAPFFMGVRGDRRVTGYAGGSAAVSAAFWEAARDGWHDFATGGHGHAAGWYDHAAGDRKALGM